MSVIDTLITDRTQSDVTELERVRNKILAGGLTSLTATEKSAWLGGMKASYNYTDLNRVGEAVNYLCSELNSLGFTVSVTGKTDWTVLDTPTPTQMQTYLNNLDALKAVLPLTTEATPDTMRWLTIAKMNAIEQILDDLGVVVVNIQEGWFQSDEVCCGEA